MQTAYQWPTHMYLHTYSWLLWQCSVWYVQVSLRPSKASLKLGSSHHSKNSDLSSEKETDKKTAGVELEGDKKSLLPRTRDDSSDEEEYPSSSSPAKGALFACLCCVVSPWDTCTDVFRGATFWELHTCMQSIFLLYSRIDCQCYLSICTDPGKSRHYPGVVPPVFYPPDPVACGYQYPRGPMVPHPLPPQQGIPLPRRPQPAAGVLPPPPPRGIMPGAGAGAPGLLPMVTTQKNPSIQ